jgi:hypothetical protein
MSEISVLSLQSEGSLSEEVVELGIRQPPSPFSSIYLMRSDGSCGWVFLMEFWPSIFNNYLTEIASKGSLSVKIRLAFKEENHMWGCQL